MKAYRGDILTVDVVGPVTVTRPVVLEAWRTAHWWWGLANIVCWGKTSLSILWLLEDWRIVLTSSILRLTYKASTHRWIVNLWTSVSCHPRNTSYYDE